MLSTSVNQYLETALWSTSGYECENLDSKYEIEDVPDAFVEEACKELDEFWEKAKHLFLEEETEDMDRIAHHFWLTRHHHGTGFWDGDYENGDKITEICKTFSEVDDELRDLLEGSEDEAA